MLLARFALILVGAAALAQAQTLRELATARGIRFGAAVNPALLNQPEYATALAREFNQAEPENAMKFGPIQPGVERYNFGPADQVVSFAIQHHMAIRGHNMVWHRQNPGWLMGEKDPAKLSAILRNHIQTVMGHFAGKIYAWDVVNEALLDDGSIRPTVWSNAPGIGLKGTDYIEQAFRWAHEADPKALLFYNDYDAEGLNAKSDAIYNLAKDLKMKGAPIDGVGLQMHLTLHPPPLAEMGANLKRLAALGLQVQITELDVRLPTDPTGHATQANLEAQARIYGDVVSLCLKYPACTAIQTWGVTDKYSWIPQEYHHTLGAALPFDENYKPKPAYGAIAQAFRSAAGR